MNTVPENYTNLIKKNIETALQDSTANPIAAFDADGTCWFSDVGRDFFQHQIDKNFFVNESYTWDDYQREEDKDVKLGLFWLAEILAGFSLEEIRAFGEAYTKEVRPSFVEHQKEIIKFLIEKNVQVYIVTASVKWTVEAAALELGIPRENVIGVQTEIEDGIITKKQKGYLSWHEGKVDALLDHTNGKKPFFASGNTTSDIPLMKTSTHLRQVVRSVGPDSEIFSGESKALAVAKEHGWHYLDFTKKEFF
ncbi:MAG: HAD family hydrolase [Bdellovibrionales bacterium]